MSRLEGVGLDVAGGVASYRDRQRLVGGFDELLDSSTAAGGDASALAAAIDAMGPGGLVSAQDEARRLVADDDIRYGVQAPDGTHGPVQRPWHIDPLPIVFSHADWAELERGIEQRSMLLSLLLDDFYGERLLLRRGVIPAEVVLGHSGFIRQADGIRGPRSRFTIGAHDLGRDATGQWRVLADRTSAPSGAGYAMANRRIVSRLMPELHRSTDLARLRGFFHTMRNAILEAAPVRAGNQRAVLLSPGSFSETAYDQSFLATLLGVALVEADDLTLRDGEVWLRTGARLARVDTIIRRVDPDFCDPLELRADSQLGLPGLVEASRRGSVSVLNPLGAGVLENPGLAPFLTAAARELLGEELALPSAPTWWCGDRTSRARVLDHLDQMIVRRIDAGEGPSVHYGWLLTSEARAQLRARIDAEPWAWVGQEPLPLSTAPVVRGDGLEPGKVVLRTFWVGGADGVTVMPGGLGRIGPDLTSPRISSATGAIAKDVWVLADGTVGSVPVHDGRELELVGLREPSLVAPRVADNMFWIGRYAARAEATARLLRVVDDLTEDYGSRTGTPGATTMQAMLEAAGAITQVTLGPEATPHAQVRAMVADAAFRGSVAYSVGRLADASRVVRDSLSYDVWHVLSRLERTIARTPKRAQQLRPTLLRAIESLLAVSGIIAESMVRDESWGYLDAGMRLERALMTTELLRVTLGKARPPVVDGQVTEAVLEVAESIITHRRRTAAGQGPAWPVHSAVELLLVDPGNPRSVAFQLERLADDFALIGDDELVARVRSIIGDIGSFDVVAACTEDRTNLAQGLQAFSGSLRDLARHLEARKFARKPAQWTLPTPWSGGWKLR